MLRVQETGDDLVLEFGRHGQHRYIYTLKSFKSRLVQTKDRHSFFIIVDDLRTSWWN